MLQLLQIRSPYRRNLIHLVLNLGTSEIHFPMSPLFSPLNTEPRQDLRINILALIWMVWILFLSSSHTSPPPPSHFLCTVFCQCNESFLIFRSSSFGSLCVEKYNVLWLHGYIPYRCLVTHFIAEDLFNILTMRDLEFNYFFNIPK